MGKNKKNKPNKKPSFTGSGKQGAGSVPLSVKPKWQHILLIVVMGFIVYSNSLNNEFVFDDNFNIVNNNFIKDFKNIRGILTGEYYSLANELSYRPIVTLSYFIDFSLWKLNVKGWHFTNILFHIANALLIYLLINIITGNLNIALIASLLYCLHPLNTEAVNVVSFREDIISMFFYLISFMCFLKYRINNQKKTVTYIISLCFFIFALFTKEMAITLPVVLILYDLCFSKESKHLEKYISTPYYWGYYIIALIFILLNIYALKPSGYVMTNDASSSVGYLNGSMVITQINMIKAIALYIMVSVLPLKLSIDHVIPVSTTLDLSVLLSAGFILLIIYFAIRFYKRSKEISFSIFYFFIALIPVSNIIPIGNLIAERYLYFSLIGYCLLIGVLIDKYLTNTTNKDNRKNYTGIIVVIIIAGFYSIRTFYRNTDFKTEISLWSKAIETYPGNQRALSARGYSYISKGNYEKAINDLSRAIDIPPDSAYEYNYRATAYHKKGLYNNAMNDFNKAIELNPKYLDVVYNRGINYFKMGDMNKAIKDYSRVIELDPKHLGVYGNRGVAYASLGLYEKALEDFDEAIRLNPGSAQDHNNKRITLQRIQQENK